MFGTVPQPLAFLLLSLSVPQEAFTLAAFVPRLIATFHGIKP
jgi:hypothetical protein